MKSEKNIGVGIGDENFKRYYKYVQGFGRKHECNEERNGRHMKNSNFPKLKQHHT